MTGLGPDAPAGRTPYGLSLHLAQWMRAGLKGLLLAHGLPVSCPLHGGIGHLEVLGKSAYLRPIPALEGAVRIRLVEEQGAGARVHHHEETAKGLGPCHGYLRIAWHELPSSIRILGSMSIIGAARPSEKGEGWPRNPAGRTNDVLRWDESEPLDVALACQGVTRSGLPVFFPRRWRTGAAEGR
jgi:hypothetical protein